MKYLLLGTSIVLMTVGIAAHAQDAEGEVESATQEEAADDENRRVRRLSDVVGEGAEEFSLGVLDLEVPDEPVEDLPDVSLPDPEQDARLQSLLTTRAFVPDDPDVQQALSDLLDEVEANAREALAADDLDLARQLSGVLEEIAPEREVITEVQAEIDSRQRVQTLQAEARAALQAGRLTAPPGDNAAELFAELLQADPGNQAAQSGLVETHQALLASAVERARELDFEGAEERIEEAEAVHSAPEAIEETRASITEFRQRYVETLRDEAISAIDTGEFDAAEERITQLVALGDDRSRIEALRRSLEDARLYGRFEPGQVFADRVDRLDRDGPDMVVIPAGSFMMGSPDNEDDRMSNEGPRHRVTFERGFALVQTEITVGEFALFVDDTGYRTDAERSGGSRVYDISTGRMDRENRINWRHDYAGNRADENLPVLHVSWNDASAYAAWLAQQTGRSYRLPSEAEFEYALRAGSQTPYWWGDRVPDIPLENVTGDDDISPSNARWNVAFSRYGDGFWGPAPAGSLQPNPFGLYDMGGNVMEWVDDCWHDSYVRAPEDGSAWVNPGCERRVIRGASWSSTPAMSRSAFRISSSSSSTDMRVGFRVARDL